MLERGDNEEGKRTRSSGGKRTIGHKGESREEATTESRIHEEEIHKVTKERRL